jgi:hypothetical protein
VLAGEFLVIDADAPLWRAVRPLLDLALRLEQNDEAYAWHGWSKRQIDAFLRGLPEHCTLVVGVWETLDEQASTERESLVLGCVCEVMEGQVRSLRTFEAFSGLGLPALERLEPGLEHALDVMRFARTQVAPVAWALFTDRATWDEWLFTDDQDEDKGELLATFARHGRCVLMGSQTAHHHL